MNDSEFTEFANRYNLRDTLPRRYIFSQLQDGALHFSTLLAKCRPAGIDPSTVYRTLYLFRKIGLVTETGEGKSRYVQLSGNIETHYHYLRCENCGKVIGFDDEILEGLLKTVARKNGFNTISSHTIEMTGICNKCRPTTS